MIKSGRVLIKKFPSGPWDNGEKGAVPLHPCTIYYKFIPASIRFGFLLRSNEGMGGVSQAYSQLVSAYCLKRTISRSAPFQNSPDFQHFFPLLGNPNVRVKIVKFSTTESATEF